MSARDRLPLAELPHRLREWLSDLPDRWQAWREGLRADPAKLWRGPAVRIVGLVLLVIIALVAINWAIGALAPGGSDRLFEKPTPWATLFVACTNPACRASYTTRQPMDLKNWPLQCEKCGARSVYRATFCKVCRHWYANPPGQAQACPFCAERKATPARESRPHEPPSRTDDEEDPW
jgi:hypothetical protein